MRAGRAERKRVESMPYGSPEQEKAADRYWARLNRFAGRHADDAIGCVADELIRKLGLKDVWYLANRRRYGRIDENRYATRGTQARKDCAASLRRMRRTA